MYLVCNECALCVCVSYANYVYVIRGLIRNTDLSKLTQILQRITEILQCIMYVQNVYFIVSSCINVRDC